MLSAFRSVARMFGSIAKVLWPPAGSRALNDSVYPCTAGVSRPGTRGTYARQAVRLPVSHAFATIFARATAIGWQAAVVASQATFLEREATVRGKGEEAVIWGQAAVIWGQAAIIWGQAALVGGQAAFLKRAAAAASNTGGRNNRGS